MNKKQLLTLFHPYLDPKSAQWQTAYMRNQFPYLGLRKPLIGKLLKPLSHRFDEEAILNLWNAEEREFQYTAIWLLRERGKTAPQSALSLYEQLLREKSWWDTVDEIAPHLVGSLVLRFPKLHKTLDTWTNDPYLWIRRASIIYQLHYKEKTDEKRLFANCLHLKDDKDFFIRKAIGWALRQYKKTAPKPVSSFLAEHGQTLSPLSLREAKA